MGFLIFILIVAAGVSSPWWLKKFHILHTWTSWKELPIDKWGNARQRRTCLRCGFIQDRSI